MIETCSTKRIFSLVVSLLFLTTVIFLLEEYVEESEADAYVMMRRTDWGKNGAHAERSKNEDSSSTPVQVQPQKGVQLNRDLIDGECYLVDEVTPLELCVECSAFEKNAIKAAHCLQTGFYDKLNCTSSGKLGLRPCFSKGAYAKSRFNMFFACMVILAGVTYVSVAWRTGVLDGHHYTKIQNFLN